VFLDHIVIGQLHPAGARIDFRHPPQHIITIGRHHRRRRIIRPPRDTLPNIIIARQCRPAPAQAVNPAVPGIGAGNRRSSIGIPDGRAIAELVIAVGHRSLGPGEQCLGFAGQQAQIVIGKDRCGNNAAVGDLLGGELTAQAVIGKRFGPVRRIRVIDVRIGHNGPIAGGIEVIGFGQQRTGGVIDRFI